MHDRGRRSSPQARAQIETEPRLPAVAHESVDDADLVGDSFPEPTVPNGFSIVKVCVQSGLVSVNTFMGGR